MRLRAELGAVGDRSEDGAWSAPASSTHKPVLLSPAFRKNQIQLGLGFLNTEEVFMFLFCPWRWGRMLGSLLHIFIVLHWSLAVLPRLASNPWAQEILLTQPPEWGLQVWATTPSSHYILLRIKHFIIKTLWQFLPNPISPKLQLPILGHFPPKSRLSSQSEAPKGLQPSIFWFWKINGL